MTGNVQVDPVKLRTAAGDTKGLHDSIAGIVNTLQKNLAARGEPWGNDDYGHQFADGENGYTAAHKNLVDGTTSMAGTFSDFSQGQKDAADLLQGTDQGTL